MLFSINLVIENIWREHLGNEGWKKRALLQAFTSFGYHGYRARGLHGGMLKREVGGDAGTVTGEAVCTCFLVCPAHTKRKCHFREIRV